MLIDAGAVKQAFKDADDAEAKALYLWATACMEVRGLIPIAGATGRKRRSDAGQSRVVQITETAPSLTGFPDEDVREVAK
jgi:hypothetical protein